MEKVKSNELCKMVQKVIDSIKRTGDFALFSKTEEEQKIMKFLQENYPELYLSLIGNFVDCLSNGGVLNVTPNGDGGVDLIVYSVKEKREHYLPVPERKRECDMHEELERE